MNAFNRLAEQEAKFLSSQFLAPVLPGRKVRVKINGVVMEMTFNGRKFGWGVFKPVNANIVKRVRDASMVEKRKYLDLFPSLKLVLCRRGDEWFGVPVNQSDKRFHIAGLCPVALAEEVQLFDTVIARFDGSTCWFDSIDENTDGRISVYLREELQKLTEPQQIVIPGITPEQRDAYLMALGPAIAADVEAKRDKTEDRLKEVLRRAGANYQSYIERSDTLTVEYVVGGERHRSTVNKENLGVLSAGICLSGGDNLQDLSTLVGVIRLGQSRHKIVRVGDNVQEDHWDD